MFRLIDSLWAGLFGTFQRMVFWELLRVFLLCLFALAGVFTLLAVLQQIQFGVSLGQALRMLPLLVPTSVPWITPPACLFASCVVYGRMANDNEAVALKAAGVDLLSVLRPAVAVGLIAAAFTAYLQFAVTPMAWRQSREVLIDDPEEAITLALKRKQSLKFDSGESEVKLTVREVQDQRLLDVVLKKRKKRAAWDDPEAVFRTREAVLRVDMANRKMWLDPKGKLESLTAGGSGSHSVEQAEPMDLPKDFDLTSLRELNKLNPMMVDWLDLQGTGDTAAALNAAQLRKADGLAALPTRPLTAEETAAAAEGLDVTAEEVTERVKAAENYRSAAKGTGRLALLMRYEYHIRPAIAFGCLLFAVLGCPVGLWANRADYLSIFVICFLPALVVYYPVLFMVGGYARDGRLPMVVGVWAANGVLAVAAGVLSWRLIRR